MNRTTMFSAMLIAFLSAGLLATATTHDDLIYLDTGKGQSLLDQVNRSTFYSLASVYETQANFSFCGVASSVMVLNALPVSKPEFETYAPYRLYTQGEFFANVHGVSVSQDIVLRQGLSLGELANVLRHLGVKAQVKYAEDLSESAFRSLLCAALRQEGTFVLANYSRSDIGQQGGGHISPIGAVNVEADAVLILDVARYKYPPVWVSIPVLYAGMTGLRLCFWEKSWARARIKF